MSLKGRLRFVGLTDTGKVREHNEDTIAYDADIGLLVLADGMGGEAHGEAGIEGDGAERDRSKAPVEQMPDDRGDQQQFDDRWHHIEHSQAQHRLDALRAAVDRTG